MSLSLHDQPGKAALAVRKDDLYETPTVAVHALLRTEKLPEILWEPACGRGAIVNVLRGAGHKVYATDLVDYGLDDAESRVDFLMEHDPGFCVGAIVTNPPFKLADQFVRHALLLCPRVVMLLRLAFLESERRRAILENGWLARVHVFRNRLPMMHRDGWDGPRATSATPFAWFVWDRAHRGPPEIHRISWDDTSAGKTLGRVDVTAHQGAR
jgi:hypothetical protein